MKKCAIVINTYKEEAAAIAGDLQKFLSERNYLTELFPLERELADYDFSGCNFAVTLGGDGTVLYAARHCAPLSIPVFPINLGQFGFIAGISKTAWQEKLSLFLDDNLPLAERSLIQVCVRRQCASGKKGADVFNSTALNDAVIKVAGAAQIAELSVSCNDEPFGHIRSDGVVVATPTGSTAYSAAAGGPIVDPDLDVLVFSPICPFSLSSRPIVMHQSARIEIQVLPSRGAKLLLSCDGQRVFPLEEDDIIEIRRADTTVQLAGCDSKVFYTALKSKLNWSGGPHA
ncbi:MAG: NAD(+)/NADH kinase [Treponema sp.]|nr:NAD(+)/NADH kinase [Candidatus Treponema caballi]